MINPSPGEAINAADSLHRRVVRLEKENRLFKLVGIVAISLVLMGQSPQPTPDESAQKIPPYMGKPSTTKTTQTKPVPPSPMASTPKNPRPDNSKDTPEISAERITTKKLRIIDDQGRPRVNIFTAGSDVYLMMGEGSGRSRLALKVEESGAASVILAGSDGEPKASWQCAADGTVRRTP